MKTGVLAFTIAGSIGVAAVAEAGSQVTWTDPVTGQRVTGRSTSPCAELPTAGPLSVRCIDDARLDPAAIGPGGGLLLARDGDRWVEGDLASGAITLVITDAAGVVQKREPLLRDLKQLRRFARLPGTRTLVTARIENVPAARGVIDGTGLGARDVVAFHLVTYTVAGGVRTVIDEADLAYDLATLKPTVSPIGLLAYTADRETVRDTETWIAYW
jgi:hypothetical protein